MKLGFFLQVGMLLYKQDEFNLQIFQEGFLPSFQAKHLNNILLCNVPLLCVILIFLKPIEIHS